MAHLEHINNALKKVSRFLEPLLPLVGCHMVEFFTMNHWETLIPPKIQQDLLDLPQEKFQYIPSPSVEFDVPDLETWCLSSSNLSTFQMVIKQHSLPALGVTSTVEQVIIEAGAELMDSVTMKGVMSDKKSHEVEIMSHVVAQLARGCGVDWIVDVGSGRGYLSSSLVLQYGMNVVAIDSSKTNTASALVRNSRIQRHWVNLKQAEQDRKEGRYVKKGKKRRVKNPQVQDLQSVDHYLELKTDHQSSQLLVPCGRYIGVTQFVTEDMDLASIISSVVDGENEIFKRSSSESEITCETKKDDSSLNNTSVATVWSSKSSFNTSFLELNTTLNKLETTDKYTIHSPPRTGNLLNRDAVNSDRSLGASIHASSVKLQEKPKHITLGLVGLHTCGNLAASSVRLFLANPSVALLCNVGCCYHLIEEEYAKNTYNYRKVSKNSYSLEVLPVSSRSSLETVNYESGCVQSELSIPSCNSECINVSYTSAVASQDICQHHALTSSQSCVCERKGDEEESKRETCRKENKGKKIDFHKEKESVRDCDVSFDPLHPSEIPDLGYGFPLSSVLRESKFALGRNTRMLSCQPADRLTQQNFTRTEALYWRALLQVVLMDRLGGDKSDIGHVGRLSAKCNTFTQYATMAIDKLGLPIQVSEDELNNYLEQYQDSRRKLELFFLLRASVAPVIEGLIILDRLAFLREQDATISSHLVQLFDPVISPRCHALLALRSTHSS